MFLTQEFTILKNTFFNCKIKIEIKTTTTTAIKNEQKIHQCQRVSGATPRGITLMTSLVFFVKSFEK